MKYMGSKSRIASEILEVILANRDDNQYYIEPFVGGCGSIDKVKGKRIGVDINPYLIAMWKGLQFNVSRPYIIDRDYYASQRNHYNRLKKVPLEKLYSVVNGCKAIETANVSVHLEAIGEDISFHELFLIGWVGYMASFNGRFFDGGYSGKTKTRDYVDEQIRNTLKQVELIKGIEFKSGNYMDIEYPESAIIYCDPPYQNTKQYSYSSKFDYDKFWEWVRDMSKRGYKVFVSEYSAPDDFEVVWEKEVTNSLHPTRTKRPTEKLFKYYI